MIKAYNNSDGVKTILSKRNGHVKCMKKACKNWLHMAGIILVVLLLVPSVMSAQTDNTKLTAPDIPDFAEILNYLSSDNMQGREAGTRGAVLASGFIAEIMEQNGLMPYGDTIPPNEPASESKPERSFFQNFEVISYMSDRDSLTIIPHMTGQQPVYQNTINLDSLYHQPFKGSETKNLSLRNVIGIIPGENATHSIIIGAHYDHLGIREGQVYNGADDNASGVSGMLALAKKWTDYQEEPPCNIIFAAWSAEEKGEIGSEYYIQQTGTNLGNTLIYINMDMISGNAPEDIFHRQISIGTLPENNNLRHIARKANRELTNPLDLDLWDVRGHYGSDYAFFSSAGIPVMTFFSGYSDNYHTPRDKFSNVDLQKMSQILELVNKCILQIIRHIKTE
jgi:hypothetical protein